MSLSSSSGIRASAGWGARAKASAERPAVAAASRARREGPMGETVSAVDARHATAEARGLLAAVAAAVAIEERAIIWRLCVWGSLVAFFVASRSSKERM